jgi:uncharacterized protein
MANPSVLVTGGSGLIGERLCQKLSERGYDVKVLTRKKKKNSRFKSYYWNPEKKEIEPGALENGTYIVHLAGANIAGKRWTKSRKQEILSSRAGTAKFLYESVSGLKLKPTAFISSSAVGFYGTVTSEKVFTEGDPAAQDFLGQTCRQWEAAADLFSENGIRTVKIRTSLVLANKGPLSKIMLPVKLGIGSPLGKGNQYMPWIHIDDLCGIFIRAIEDTNLDGAYNAVAPDHKTNRVFTKTLATILKRPLIAPNVPAFVLKGLLGEMSVIALEGSRVSSEKIKNSGFEFKYPDLEQALKNICRI